ncbi:NAD(P)H-binding protein [Anaerocolumna aminovalerica]|uniref:SDR family oxidoreductase n=1 Tax=Anaerocolumna aminovalerica TaxID=1527 RepID=UPI001C0EF629|nr:NAD(P)H-binding protein [Anaerocolumna aminovalerica]MBU5331130.1 NAD(P)H-binding protein [Anaerocolumna aminovalerica]
MLLVTGITGHTGRYFLQELINHKYEGPIRCIVRETSDTSLLDNSGLNIENIVGDLQDREFIKKVTVGVNTIMHIYNIHHSPTIVEAAIKNHVDRVILIHTTGIYSKFKYAAQGYKNIEKKVSEMVLDEKCQTKITILRPTMIYGDLCDRNMSKFIKMIDMFRIMPVINGGKNLIQPVNAKDLGKAFYSVLISSDITAGKVYDLSGEKPLQMIEVFRLISDNLNKKTIFVSVSLELGVFLTKLVKILTLGKLDYIERVQRMGENRNYSHEYAKNDFGYKPMSFEKGIKIEVQEYLSQY